MSLNRPIFQTNLTAEVNQEDIVLLQQTDMMLHATESLMQSTMNSQCFMSLSDVFKLLGVQECLGNIHHVLDDINHSIISRTRPLSQVSRQPINVNILTKELSHVSDESDSDCYSPSDSDETESEDEYQNNINSTTPLLSETSSDDEYQFIDNEPVDQLQQLNNHVNKDINDQYVGVSKLFNSQVDEDFTPLNDEKDHSPLKIHSLFSPPKSGLHKRRGYGTQQDNDDLRSLLFSPLSSPTKK